MQPLHLKLVNLEPPDDRAPDRQTSHRQRPNGDSSDRRA